MGNQRVPKEEIVKVLDKYGIGIGKLRYFKKISKIKNYALIELDSLSWLWVSIDGTRVLVEVREKDPGKGIFPNDVFCNLVATHPGQIVDMRVRHGRKAVERNMVVDEGQLLVSGISETKYHGNRYIHADGEIMAKTWRSKGGEYSLINKYDTPTGKKEKMHTLNIFGLKVKNIFKSKPNFKNYKKKINRKHLKISDNFYLPLTFTTEEFYEIITVNEILSKEEALSRAVDSLSKNICSERSADAVTTDIMHTCTELENGNIYVYVTVESIENIARKEKIVVDTLEEEPSGENN